MGGFQGVMVRCGRSRANTINARSILGSHLMLGHDGIIELRRRGQAPALVLIDLDRDNMPMPTWKDWPNVSPAIASVWIQPHDAPSRLDLRFLVDLTVQVSGTDQARVDAVAAACIEAGAKRTIAVTVEDTPKTMIGARTVRVFDTDGKLTWQN